MKNINFLSSLIVTAILVSSNAFAGPVISGGGVGDANKYASCTNGQLNFVVLGTAVPGFIQGVLAGPNGSQDTFKCSRPTHKTQNLKPASAGEVVWSCTQYPENDGSYMVSLERSGVTGIVSAYLLQKQIYPLGPQAVATMNCK